MKLSEREQRYFNAGVKWSLDKLTSKLADTEDIERCLKVDEDPDLFTKGAWEGLAIYQMHMKEEAAREDK